MSKITASRYLAEALKAYEVDHVFHMPSIIIPALAAMEGMGIRRISTHSENGAVYMADGYARTSGKPAVVAGQNVGSANLSAGLQDPYLGNSPVIAITGGPSTTTRYRHFYQELDAHSMYNSVTKWNAAVPSLDRLPDLLRQAFRAATTGCPQPVHLELPDALGAMPGEIEVSNSVPMAEPRFSRYPAFRPEPSMDDIHAAAKLISEAERPVILAGGGTKISGAYAEVTALAEKLNIPVVTSITAKGAIPETHNLAVGVSGTYPRMCANQVMAEADLVFFIGCETGNMVTNNWRNPSIGGGATIIQMDVEPMRLGVNYPNAVSILADAKIGLQKLIGEMAPSQGRTGWLKRVREIVDAWHEKDRPRWTSDASPMRPERMVREIEKALPDDGVVLFDTGHAGMWGAAYFDAKPTQTFLRAAGSLGWSYPASLGAKCAAPDKKVVTFTGDGGFLYHLAEMETALRYGINTVTVVNNNYSINQGQGTMDRAYGGKQTDEAYQMWVFSKAHSFAKIAEAFGCVGMRVERPDELADALRTGLAMDKPVIIDAVSDINAMADRT